MKCIFRSVFFIAILVSWAALFPAFDYVDQESFFSEYTLSELSIDSVVEKLGKTQTVTGKNLFKTMLLQPTTNIDLVNKRQAIIKQFSHDDTLYSSIRKELEIIAKNEKALTIYQNKNHRFHTDIRRLVPINPVLRNALAGSPLLLECFYLLLFGNASFDVIKQFGLLGFIKEIAFLIDGSESSFSVFRALTFGFGEVFKQHNIFQTQKALKKNGELQGLSKLIHLGYVNNIYYKLSENMPRAFAGLIAVLPLIYYDFKLVETMSESYKNTSEIISIMQKLQEYLVSLSSYFSAYGRLEELIKKSDLGNRGLLQNTKNIEANKSLLKGLSALQSSTFNQKTKYAFYHGKALYVHLMLCDNIDILNNTVSDIAQLDVYITIAALIREQNKEKPFCFVNFITTSNTEPIIVAKRSWVPMFQSSIKDDVIFNKNLSKIVLTGPNGSGKSVFLKKIGIIICMAQVFGIATANFCEMTPFCYVRTALDCKGDVEQGYSKFTQQKAMMKSFIDLAVSTINTNKKAIFLIDEALSGTVEDEASKRILEFLDATKAAHNSIVITSTHLPDPVYKRSKNSSFIDYCLKVNIIDDSESAVMFQKTYLCEPGIINWWFDNPYLRSQYIEQN